jgi:hypothetical protein
LGVTFEAVVATQALYQTGPRNAKFRPVVFTQEDEQFISLELRRFNRYRVDTPSTTKTCFGGCMRHHGSSRQQLVRSRTFHQNPHLNCFQETIRLSRPLRATKLLSQTSALWNRRKFSENPPGKRKGLLVLWIDEKPNTLFLKKTHLNKLLLGELK